MTAYFANGLKGFGGLGTFFRSPEDRSPFTAARDRRNYRPTAVVDGFLTV